MKRAGPYIYGRMWNTNHVPISERFPGEYVEPCPFCRSRNLAVYMSHSPHICCMQCGADGPECYVPRYDVETRQYECLKLWNERPQG